MDKNQREVRLRQEDADLNRGLLWVVGAVLLECLLMVVNRWYINFYPAEIGVAEAILNVMRVLRVGGGIVGIRGPFGRGFPFEKMRGHDILLVAGGLGIAPLRSLINNIHDERSDFGKVTIIYGSKTPQEVMFRNQFEMWRHRKDFDLYLTVDHADETWDGEEGLVTKPFEHLEINPDTTFGALCGPPLMYRFVVQEMRKKGISYDHIYMSFERHMKCGMGKCGHCQIGHQYVCIDGPVFNYWEAKNIQGSM